MAGERGDSNPSVRFASITAGLGGKLQLAQSGILAMWPQSQSCMLGETWETCDVGCMGRDNHWRRDCLSPCVLLLPAPEKAGRLTVPGKNSWRPGWVESGHLRWRVNCRRMRQRGLMTKTAMLYYIASALAAVAAAIYAIRDGFQPDEYLRVGLLVIMAGAMLLLGNRERGKAR